MTLSLSVFSIAAISVVFFIFSSLTSGLIPFVFCSASSLWKSLITITTPVSVFVISTEFPADSGLSFFSTTSLLFSASMSSARLFTSNLESLNKSPCLPESISGVSYTAWYAVSDVYEFILLITIYIPTTNTRLRPETQ